MVKELKSETVEDVDANCENWSERKHGERSVIHSGMDNGES